MHNKMRIHLVNIVISLVLLELVLADPGPNKAEINVRKRKKDVSKSTSSDTREVSNSGEDSLDLSSSAASSEKSEKNKNKYKPKSSNERTGWRKWRRKCTPCPEDMRKKWRDPSIAWICAGYQRARRTFKSKCMMHYRNCQDGTMFVKIHNNRCKNDTKRDLIKHGDHFFYDYKVDLADDSSATDISSSSSADGDWKSDWHLA